MKIDVFVEIPRGTRNKYEFDKEANVFRLDRMLFSSMHYPLDYGFVPNTLADDGDPLDALILNWEPTFPGCMVECTPLGYLQMSDDKGVDQKLICVPTGDPIWRDAKELTDIPQHLLKEIAHFFEVYKTLENKKTDVHGWHGRTEAEQLIAKFQQQFKK